MGRVLALGRRQSPRRSLAGIHFRMVHECVEQAPDALGLALLKQGHAAPVRLVVHNLPRGLGEEVVQKVVFSASRDHGD